MSTIVATKHNVIEKTVGAQAEQGKPFWSDEQIYLCIAKNAARKLPVNGITVESLNLQRNKLWTAVASEWKSSMGMANTARLEPELVTRLESQLDQFTKDIAQKVISNVTNYSKRSQVDYRNRQIHWKLTMSGKELMDLRDQKLHCSFHITEKERRLKDLLAKPGDWIEQIKDCERNLVELRVVAEAIEQKIAGIEKS